VRDEPLLRLAWRAISHPRAFYAGLDDRPQLPLALAVMGVSVLLGAAILALLALRATGSDAWAPVLLGLPVAILVHVATVTLLGGLTLMLPAGLDLRAFEIVAWAWVPAGALGASLLPIGLFAPWATLIGGVLALLPAWHLWMVWRGLEVHALRGRRAAFLFYVLAVFAFPTVLVLFTATVLSRLS
jgi:hypothetical protein